MPNQNMMICIMISLPEQYDPIVCNLEMRQKKKDNNRDKLTLDDLHE